MQRQRLGEAVQRPLILIEQALPIAVKHVRIRELLQLQAELLLFGDAQVSRQIGIAFAGDQYTIHARLSQDTKLRNCTTL